MYKEHKKCQEDLIISMPQWRLHYKVIHQTISMYAHPILCHYLFLCSGADFTAVRVRFFLAGGGFGKGTAYSWLYLWQRVAFAGPGCGTFREIWPPFPWKLPVPKYHNSSNDIPEGQA